MPSGTWLISADPAGYVIAGEGNDQVPGRADYFCERLIV
ncbi:hypothetical protein BOVA172_2141 [Bacteroides ovatus]|nr:hypothetical protein BOVA172_2141 [Bacteroides ovatus]CAG9925601.1 hypothetical protein BOVA435_4180 [Bacteroides ovatus]